MYFTIEETCNFQNIKDQLMGFVTAVLPLLHKKLFPHLINIFNQVTQKGDSGIAVGDVSGVTTKVPLVAVIVFIRMHDMSEDIYADVVRCPPGSCTEETGISFEMLLR